MKVDFHEDEIYPVYSYYEVKNTDPNVPGIEVSDEQVAEWYRIQHEWDEMQNQMSELHREVQRPIRQRIDMADYISKLEAVNRSDLFSLKPVIDDLKKAYGHGNA